MFFAFEKVFFIKRRVTPWKDAVCFPITWHGVIIPYKWPSQQVTGFFSPLWVEFFHPTYTPWRRTWNIIPWRFGSGHFPLQNGWFVGSIVNLHRWWPGPFWCRRVATAWQQPASVDLGCHGAWEPLSRLTEGAGGGVVWGWRNDGWNLCRYIAFPSPILMEVENWVPPILFKFLSFRVIFHWTMIMGERVVTRFHLYRSYAGFTYVGLPNIFTTTVVCALLSNLWFSGLSTPLVGICFLIPWRLKLTFYLGSPVDQTKWLVLRMIYVKNCLLAMVKVWS